MAQQRDREGFACEKLSCQYVSAVALKKHIKQCMHLMGDMVNYENDWVV